MNRIETASQAITDIPSDISTAISPDIPANISAPLTPSPPSASKPGILPDHRALMLNADISFHGSRAVRIAAAQQPAYLLRGAAAIRLARGLMLFDGSRSVDEVWRRVDPSDHEVFSQLVSKLTELGIMTPAPPRNRRWRIGVVGEGPLAAEIRKSLQAYSEVTFFSECLVPTRQAQSISRTTQDSWRQPQHWMRIVENQPDLVVVATSRQAPDPAITWLLSRSGIPHLIIAAHQDYGVIGPFVVPGQTACCFCTTSPEWQPDEIAEHSTHEAFPLAPVIQWASSMAAPLCWSYLAKGGVPPILTSQGELHQIALADTSCPVCAQPAHEASHESPSARPAAV